MICHHHFLHWFNFLTFTSLHTIIITITTTTTTTTNPSLTLSKGGEACHGEGKGCHNTHAFPSGEGKILCCTTTTHTPSLYWYIKNQSIYICGFMNICNIYIHTHLYYITITNIFFFKKHTLSPPSIFTKTCHQHHLNPTYSYMYLEY